MNVTADDPPVKLRAVTRKFQRVVLRSIVVVLLAFFPRPFALAKTAPPSPASTPVRAAGDSAIRAGAALLDAGADRLVAALNRRPEYFANFTFFLHEKDTIIASNDIRESAEARVNAGLAQLARADSAASGWPEVKRIREILARQETLSASLDSKHDKMDLEGIIADLRSRADLMRQMSAATRGLLHRINGQP